MTTKALVPRADGEGSIGTAAKAWGAGYLGNITVSGALYADHIAEKTGAHGIVLDHNVTAAGNITLANTKDLLCAVGAGSDIGATGTRFGSIFGTSLYAVTHYADHIAENTGSHTITLDSNVTVAATKDILAAATTCDIGTYDAPFGAITGSSLTARAADGTGGYNYFDAYSGVNAWDCSNFYFRRARGTLAAPATLVDGDFLGVVDFAGYYSGWYIGANVRAQAVGNWDGINHGTMLNLMGTPYGSAAMAAACGIDGSAIYMYSGKHIKSWFAAGTSDVGDSTYNFRNGYFTKHFVDHIGEFTGSHTITFDNNVTQNGYLGINTAPDTTSRLRINGGLHFGTGSASNTGSGTITSVDKLCFSSDGNASPRIYQSGNNIYVNILTASSKVWGFLDSSANPLVEINVNGLTMASGKVLDASAGKTKLAVFNQASEPSTTDIPDGCAAFWTDTDDAKCYLCYNHGGTVKTVELA